MNLHLWLSAYTFQNEKESFTAQQLLLVPPHAPHIQFAFANKRNSSPRSEKSKKKDYSRRKRPNSEEIFNFAQRTNNLQLSYHQNHGKQSRI